MDKVSSEDKTLMAVKAGHVGVVAGRSARQNFFPKLEAWLAARS
jgi:poly-beta-hydroxyalkanoate depolymerase